jgi:mannose-1-phosphate guanylyltransferase
MDGERCSTRLWSIVPGGGSGENSKPWIERWLGQSKPKQFCTFVGTRSMLQHTLDRVSRIGRPEQVVTVVSREHAREAWGQLKTSHGMVILQPSSRDTAVSIFLALTHIRARDPEAPVIIAPPDHFIYPEHRFRDAVHHAAWATEWLPDRLVVLGVAPDRLELDCVWIQPGEILSTPGGHPIRPVQSFLERPTAVQADAALSSGALWSTQIVAARVDTLWEVGWHCCPEIMANFERLQHAIGTAQEGQVLDAIYREMPSASFSSDILQRIPERLTVLEMNGVLWSDWSRPERIASTLRWIGRQPMFPLDCLDSPFVPILTETEPRLTINA